MPMMRLRIKRSAFAKADEQRGLWGDAAPPAPGDRRIKDNPRLRKKQIIDKRGRKTTRWVRRGEDEAAPREAAEEEPKAGDAPREPGMFKDWLERRMQEEDERPDEPEPGLGDLANLSFTSDLGEGRSITYRPHRRDGDAIIVRADDHDIEYSVPAVSIRHHFEEMSGEIKGDPERGGEPEIDWLYRGQSELLGRGNDGVVFKVNSGWRMTKVVKAFGVTPFQPMNSRAYRTPDEAVRRAERVRDLVWELTDKDKDLRAFLLPPTFVHDEATNRAFLIRDYLPHTDQTKLTTSQLRKVQRYVRKMHDAGVAILDDIQVGMEGRGKHSTPMLYDLGSARRLDDMTESEAVSARAFDMEKVESLYRKANVPFIPLDAPADLAERLTFFTSDEADWVREVEGDERFAQMLDNAYRRAVLAAREETPQGQAMQTTLLGMEKHLQATARKLGVDPKRYKTLRDAVMHEHDDEARFTGPDPATVPGTPEWRDAVLRDMRMRAPLLDGVLDPDDLSDEFWRLAREGASWDVQYADEVADHVFDTIIEPRLDDWLRAFGIDDPSDPRQLVGKGTPKDAFRERAGNLLLTNQPRDHMMKELRRHPAKMRWTLMAVYALTEAGVPAHTVHWAMGIGSRPFINSSSDTFLTMRGRISSGARVPPGEDPLPKDVREEADDRLRRAAQWFEGTPLAEFFALYPMSSINSDDSANYRNSRGGRNTVHAYASGTRLVFSRDALTQKNPMIGGYRHHGPAPYGWSHATSSLANDRDEYARNLMIHEATHVLDHVSKNERMGFRNRMAEARRTEFDASSPRGFVYRRRPTDARGISSYATTNDKEYFAETMTAYLAAPEELARIDPPGYKAAASIVRDLPKRLAARKKKVVKLAADWNAPLRNALTGTPKTLRSTATPLSQALDEKESAS